MKTHWKMLAAVLFIAAAATGLAFNSWTRAQVVGVLKQLAQGRHQAEPSSSDKAWIEESAAKSSVPWDRVLTLEVQPDSSHRPQDGSRHTADRADDLEAVWHDRLRPRESNSRAHPVR